MSPPYHHHVHYRSRRCGGLFRGVLLVGLGFWIARATERRHHLEGPRGPPPAFGAPPGAPGAGEGEAGRAGWRGHGWCRRHREEAASPGAVAYGPAEVRGEDVPAVLAALAAFQRTHPENSPHGPTPDVPPAAAPDAELAAAATEQPGTPAGAQVGQSTPGTTNPEGSRTREDLARIDRIAAALQQLRDAIEKEGPRLV